MNNPYIPFPSKVREIIKHTDIEYTFRMEFKGDVKPGQFFEVEKYYLEKERLREIKQKHINVVLKLNCYRSVSIDEETEKNPSPARIAEEMMRRSLYIMVDGAMILSEPDDTHMTVFNPDRELLELIRMIASGKGLFVWSPEEEK